MLKKMLFMLCFLAAGISYGQNGTNTINAGQQLNAGEKLVSTNGAYSLEMQTDGNLVIYQVSPRTPKWSTGTDRGNGCFAVMQTDGNLVLYTPGQRTAPWKSETMGRNVVKAVLTDAGNLVLYGSNDVEVTTFPLEPMTAEELIRRYNEGERNLSRKNLTRAYLRAANLSGANLSGSDLSGANLTSANLSGSDLSGANLSGANLQMANLTNAILRHSDFRRAALINANLTGAHISFTNIEGANMSGAILGTREGYVRENHVLRRVDPREEANRTPPRRTFQRDASDEYEELSNNMRWANRLAYSPTNNSLYRRTTASAVEEFKNGAWRTIGSGVSEISFTEQGELKAIMHQGSPLYFLGEPDYWSNSAFTMSNISKRVACNGKYFIMGANTNVYEFHEGAWREIGRAVTNIGCDGTTFTCVHNGRTLRYQGSPDSWE